MTELIAVLDGRGRLYRICTSEDAAQRQRHGAGKGATIGAVPAGSVKVRDNAGKQRIMSLSAYLEKTSDAFDFFLAALNAALERRQAGDGYGWGQWFKVDGDGWQVRMLKV